MWQPINELTPTDRILQVIDDLVGGRTHTLQSIAIDYDCSEKTSRRIMYRLSNARYSSFHFAMFEEENTLEIKMVDIKHEPCYNI